MLLLSTQFRINIILHLLLGISNNADIVASLQCYVCGPKATISCDNFSPSNKSLIQECPDAKSCSTQTHGNLVERSCEEIKLLDCKKANDVEYCYCAENLCNGGKDTFLDDEDLTEEGSGTPVIKNNVIPEQKRTNTTSQSSHTCFYLFSTSIPILAILLN